MSKELPKVVPLHKNDVVETLETLLNMARAGEVRNLVAAGHLNGGNIFTAVAKADVIEHHTLNSYLQTSAILRTVEQK
jgi:hypothetical protein